MLQLKDHLVEYSVAFVALTPTKRLRSEYSIRWSFFVCNTTKD